MAIDRLVTLIAIAAFLASLSWALAAHARLRPARQELRGHKAALRRARADLDRGQEELRRLQPVAEELRRAQQELGRADEGLRRAREELARRPSVEYVEKEVQVERQEPEVPIGSYGDGRKAEHLLDPQVLPDVPDSVPDSVADGARLGGLVVRGASVRGDAARTDGKVRRQTMALAVIDTFQPPVLLTAVAAGRRGSRYSQVGAAQACRSIQYRLADRAPEIQDAWQDLIKGDDDAGPRLAESLRDTLAALEDPLKEAARARALGGDQLATELTCVLTRLGDASSRHHLVFGVGPGSVLALGADGRWDTVFPDGEQAGEGAALFPPAPDPVRWTGFQTGPGQAIVVCAGSTAGFLERGQVRDLVTAEWTRRPPPLTRLMWQLNTPDQKYRDDRTAVGLWELDLKAAAPRTEG
ncbi:protein phosphatase 2C domain-containing protein [Sphaerisporangium viridialbum]|uniref:protein phosphatase 2C domain-containing protein n=1 Tax=Sphaerisporangium viridialbum TaxID=46189 RepID=UPI003C73064B